MITPPVDNVNNIDPAGNTGYHGYWARDYFRIDEHFGTIDDFKELTSLMHSPEFQMKLVLDYALTIQTQMMKMNLVRYIETVYL